MPVIERSALVPYSTEQMFDLVNGVLDYPKFLGWCHTTELHSHSDESMEASITVQLGGLRQTFTTRNDLRRPTAIDIRLLRGPFQALEGHWSFRALGDDGSRVALHLAFDVSGRLLESVFASGFSKVAERMVADFCNQADERYG